MPELSLRRRMAVLVICCMSLQIVGLDNTIVNVALPSLQRDLNASVSGLQWTIDAYTLVLASLLMLSGSTADRLGRRRVFQTGLLVFTVGSLLCSVAPSLGWLVVFRMVQAVGGSMLNPVALSILSNTFTEPRERAQALGVWGGMIGISMALGPVVGGALVHAFGWRAVFWVNVPVGLVAVALTARFVPESKAGHARRPDPIGQLSILVGLAALTYAIITGPHEGWTSARVLGAFTVAALATTCLLVYEPQRAEPLLELKFFRSIPFSGATAIAACAFFALGGFLFLNTLYLQEARGLSALEAGLYTLPMAVMTMVFAPVSGALVGRRGTRMPLVLAGLAITVSSLLLTAITRDTPMPWLLVAYMVFGAGFGLVNTPATSTAVSGMPAGQAGVAAATTSTSRQVGQSLGVAVVGAAASAQGNVLTSGFASATHTGWWLSAACGFLILLLGVLTTTRGALRSADGLAHESFTSCRRSGLSR